MAVVGDTLPHCTGDGSQANPYIFNTPEGFLEAIVVEHAYIEAATTQTPLVFDCNNVSMPIPWVFNFDYLDCKGLTILNALSDHSSEVIIRIRGSFSRTIKNLNMFNICIISQGMPAGLIYQEWQVYGGPTVPYIADFINCNFAGIFIGYAGTYGDLKSAFLLGREGNNYDYDTVRLRFTDSTFNFNLSDPYNATNRPFYFACSNTGMYFRNCTLQFSGGCPGGFMLDYQDGSYNRLYFNNVTVRNSPTNPLVVTYSNSIKLSVGQNNTFSGYNYYKLYAQTNWNIIVTDALGLINSTRLTAGNTKTLTGIVMQEYNQSDPDQFLLATEPGDWSTDWTNYFTKSGNVYTHVTGAVAPTFTTNTYYNVPSDYIYLDENLSNAGFLVGQVIT